MASSKWRVASGEWARRLAVLALGVLLAACGSASAGPGGGDGPAPRAEPSGAGSESPGLGLETRDSGLGTEPPRPVRLPQDDAPHDVLTEWWYYTGHLRGPDEERYGFEFVIFQSVRGRNPIGYLSHFAVTDPQLDRFSYAARMSIRSELPETLEMDVDGWTLSGGGGQDTFSADLGEYALELTLTALKPPVLHRGGYIVYDPAGGSYYVSRPRMEAAGRLRVDGQWMAVEGLAWHDHQWGNFIVPSVGGWDWYSFHLDDWTELMVYELRDETDAVADVVATYVDRDGRGIDVPSEAIAIEALGTWNSPHTGGEYPSGWRLHVGEVPELGLPRLELTVNPLLMDQELAFETMPYWEGAVEVHGTSNGRPVSGDGYVELTGYAP